MTYLKKQRLGWYVALPVPADLQGKPSFVTSNGRPMDKVVQSLGTRNLDKALAARWVRKTEFDRQVERLRLGRGLNLTHLRVSDPTNRNL